MTPTTSSPSDIFTRTGVELSISFLRYLASSKVCSGARADLPSGCDVITSSVALSFSRELPKPGRPAFRFLRPPLHHNSRYAPRPAIPETAHAPPAYGMDPSSEARREDRIPADIESAAPPRFRRKSCRAAFRQSAGKSVHQ